MKVRRDYFERRPYRAPRCRALPGIEAIETTGPQHVDHVGWGIPRRDGHALPGRRRWCRCGRTKADAASLSAGVGLDLQRAVVFPGDANAPGCAHDGPGAERLAAAG